MRTVRCSGRFSCYVPPLPMWTEFLTYACENITLPQLLLWTVIICKTNLKNWTTRYVQEDKHLKVPGWILTLTGVKQFNTNYL